MGSVAYRKAMEEDTPRVHFNFFTVDLNEDLGAFFGPVLQQQTQFVNEVMHYILSLYQNSPRKPESVILIGHSMVRFIWLKLQSICYINYFVLHRNIEETI